jgi:hypothetical protein
MIKYKCSGCGEIHDDNDYDPKTDKLIDKYYLIEIDGSSEGFVLFWAKEGKGYTIELDLAGLFDYDFVKEHYLGKSENTRAIEKNVFEKLMKTQIIVYNHFEILNKVKELELQK